MSTEATSQPDAIAGSDLPPEPRRLSPDIAEVLHLIGAMERLIDDAEERRKSGEAVSGT